jgi:DNA-binding MarR family transcriptional regulator
MKQTLGTKLRHLLEQLDGAVDRAYAKVGLDYRPRYTPVMRVLIDSESSTVGEIAERAGISQPAATQTIALMVGAGIVSAGPGAEDARKRIIRLTAKGRTLVPGLQQCWLATSMAAESLDKDLPAPLGPLLDAASTALEKRSYDERIDDARGELDRGQSGMPARHSPARGAAAKR